MDEKLEEAVDNLENVRTLQGNSAVALQLTNLRHISVKVTCSGAAYRGVG